jgi:hypothetical protein
MLFEAHRSEMKTQIEGQVSSDLIFRRGGARCLVASLITATGVLNVLPMRLSVALCTSKVGRSSKVQPVCDDQSFRNSSLHVLFRFDSGLDLNSL